MRLSNRLLWIFAALFLLCGLPLLFLDSENPDSASKAVAGMAALSLGGFALSLAWNACESGGLQMLHFGYQRATQPRRFFATVAVLILAGCATVVAGIRFLLFQ